MAGHSSPLLTLEGISKTHPRTEISSLKKWNSKEGLEFVLVGSFFLFLAVKKYGHWKGRNYKYMQMIIILTYDFLVPAIFLLNGLSILKSYTIYILLQYLICFKLCGKMNIIVFFFLNVFASLIIYFFGNTSLFLSFITLLSICLRIFRNYKKNPSHLQKEFDKSICITVCFSVILFLPLFISLPPSLFPCSVLKHPPPYLSI